LCASPWGRCPHEQGPCGSRWSHCHWIPWRWWCKEWEGRGLSLEKRKLGIQLFCRPSDRGVNSARLVALARRVSKCKSSALEVERPMRAPVASFMREEEVGDPIVLQATRSWGKKCTTGSPRTLR
jgi:hypothetical protein